MLSFTHPDIDNQPDIDNHPDSSNDERSTADGAGISPTHDDGNNDDDEIKAVENVLKRAAQTHLTEDDLTQYIQGRTNPVTTARMEGHIDHCRECEARYYRKLVLTNPSLVRVRR